MKIFLTLLLIITFSISSETIFISNGYCIPFNKSEKLETHLEGRLGFLPVSMIRGQIEIKELVTVYTTQKCTKGIKGLQEKASFSCEIQKQIGINREKKNVTKKTYTGTCF